MARPRITAGLVSTALGIPQIAKQALDQRLTEIGATATELSKQAVDPPVTSRALAGRLYLSKSGWLLLSVPNALVNGAFAALDEPGTALPLNELGILNAHISVMRPEEIEQLGGADKIVERGKMFHYTLGPVREVAPLTWDGVSRVWFIEVDSPELRLLRKSYGLPPLPIKDGVELKHHITIAIRKVGVLGRNAVSKAAAELFPKQVFNTRRTNGGRFALRNKLISTPVAQQTVALTDRAANGTTPKIQAAQTQPRKKT